MTKIFKVQYDEQWQEDEDDVPSDLDWERDYKQVSAKDGESAIEKVKKLVLAQKRNGEYEEDGKKIKYHEKCVNFCLIGLDMLAETDD